MAIKYLRHTDTLDECLSTDEYGNRIHTASGEYAIVIEPSKETPVYKPMSLTMVDGEWKPMQMEFDFG